MKITNISGNRILLADLKITNSGQSEGRRGEDRYVPAGASVYLPNTSEVFRSAISGDIRKFVQKNIIQIEDTVTLAAAGSPGDSVVLTHNFNFPPGVYVLKQVASTWVDATGTVDITHNQSFTTVTIANITGGSLTFLIRLL